MIRRLSQRFMLTPWKGIFFFYYAGYFRKLQLMLFQKHLFCVCADYESSNLTERPA